ncbi:hypothetical protein REPUB_Repub04eG0222600 [Reevesia pubescens]
MRLQDRRLPEYEKGVAEFLDMAFAMRGNADKILCPCCKCNNGNWKTGDEVKSDLFEREMKQSYIGQR